MRRISDVVGVALVGLSLAALALVVIFGLAMPPQPPPQDEGTPARIFQLIIVSLVPVGLLYLATADWRRPWQSVRPLVVSAVITILAFAALYYLENVR